MLEIIEEALRIADSIISACEARGEYIYDIVNVKRSVPEAGCCELCEDCADQGWIDDDDVFDSGQDSPPHHPNCLCEIEYKEKRVRVKA